MPACSVQLFTKLEKKLSFILPATINTMRAPINQLYYKHVLQNFIHFSPVIFLRSVAPLHVTHQNM